MPFCISCYDEKMQREKKVTRVKDQALAYKGANLIPMQQHTRSTPVDSHGALRIIFRVELAHNGIDVFYDPELFVFDDAEEKTLTSLQIKSFFIRKGFKLSNVLQRVEVYRCAISLERGAFGVDSFELHYAYPDAFFENQDDVSELNSIVSYLLILSE